MPGSLVVPDLKKGLISFGTAAFILIGHLLFWHRFALHRSGHLIRHAFPHPSSPSPSLFPSSPLCVCVKPAKSCHTDTVTGLSLEAGLTDVT